MSKRRARAVVRGRPIQHRGDSPSDVKADAMRRFGTDKPDLRFGSNSWSSPSISPTRRSVSSRPITSAASSCRVEPTSLVVNSTPGRNGPSSAALGFGLCHRWRRRHPRRTGGQEPERGERDGPLPLPGLLRGMPSLRGRSRQRGSSVAGSRTGRDRRSVVLDQH